MKPLLLDLLTKTDLETLRDSVRARIESGKSADLETDLLCYQLAVCKVRLKYYKAKPARWDKGLKEAMSKALGGGK